MEIKDFNYLNFSNNYDKTQYFNNLTTQEPDVFLLHYFTDMEGFFRINNIKYPISSGAFFITFPDDHFFINPVKTKGSLGYFVIKLKAKENERDIRSFILNELENKSFQLNPGQKILLEEALGKLNSEIESQRESARYRIISFLYDLPATQNQKYNYQDNHKYIEKAVKYMHTRVYKELKLNELCSHLCISEPHCIRLFKGRMGTTPMKYFTSIKIEEAISQLLTTNKPLAQIAEELHFSSAAHFSKTFKQFMSISPTQYRSNYINTLEHRQKVMEKEKEHANALLETVIDAIPDLVFIKDTNGILISGNKAICRVLGLTKEEFAGKSDYELFPKDEADFFKIRDAMVYRNNRAYKNDEEMTYPDGIKRAFEVHKAPFHDEQGNILGLVGISRDITDRLKERRELEEARSRQQSMSQQQAEAMTRLSEQLSSLIDKHEFKIGSGETSLAEFSRIRMLLEGLNSFIQTIFRNPVLNSKGTDPEFLFAGLEKMVEEVFESSDTQITFHSPNVLPEIVFVDGNRLRRTIYFLINLFTIQKTVGELIIRNTCMDKLLITNLMLKAESIPAGIGNLIEKLSERKPGIKYSASSEDPIEITMANIELEMLKSKVRLVKREPSLLLIEMTTPFPSGIEYLNQYYSPKNRFN